jgi:hypothetical protein
MPRSIGEGARCLKWLRQKFEREAMFHVKHSRRIELLSDAEVAKDDVQ